MIYIKIKFQAEGVHRWKDCPHEDVAFLREWHRHIFHFDVKIEVLDSDRELEFIRLKRQLEEWASIFFMDPVESSCEHIAKWCAAVLMEEHGRQRLYDVYVSEDGENGGGYRWERSRK